MLYIHRLCFKFNIQGPGHKVLSVFCREYKVMGPGTKVVAGGLFFPESGFGLSLLSYEKFNLI